MSNRKLKLTFGNKTLDEKYDIYFKLENSSGGFYPAAHFTIKGLNIQFMKQIQSQTIIYLGSLSSPLLNLKFYINDSLVFQGKIYDAKPNYSDVNHSLDLNCYSFYEGKAGNVEIEAEKGTTITELLTKISSTFNLNGVKNNTTINPELQENYFANKSLTLTGHLQQVRDRFSIYNLNIYLDNLTNQIIITSISNFKTSTSSVYTIENNTIIGEINLTGSEINLTTLLDNNLLNNNIFKIDSLRYPEIKDIQYLKINSGVEGETRGKKWFTNLNLIKLGAL